MRINAWESGKIMPTVWAVLSRIGMSLRFFIFGSANAFLYCVPQDGRTEFYMKKVGIVMGSDSDLAIVEKAVNTLDEYGVGYEVRVISAHRTPSEAAEFARGAKERGIGVIIAAAGMAAHLAGAMAANTTLPVIGIPVSSQNFDGLDALLSTVQMPSGIPVATVAVNGGVNAALLAIQILATADGELSAKLDAARVAAADKVRAKDRTIAERFNTVK